jgi:hypothetical protein
MKIFKKMLGVFNMMAADSAAEKAVQKKAARYGLETGSTSTGGGWKDGLEQKDYHQAVSDINEGLARDHAGFRVKEEGAPNQNAGSVSIETINKNLAKENAKFTVI